MNKLMYALIAFISLTSALAVYAEEPSIEEELQSLKIPANEAPIPASEEKVYSVQERLVPLSKSSEVILGVASNVHADAYINSQEVKLGYRYHFNDRWHLTGQASFVTNSLSGAGETLIAQHRLVPDVAYTKNRFDLLVGYNLFYGKFRVSLDKVFYFDQYIAIGPGAVKANTGSAIGPVVDIGFVFWMGRDWNAQFGVRDSYHNEKRALSSGYVNDIILHLDLAYRFGGEK